MPVGDFVGWVAAALMVATFSCRDPLWMRRLAYGTNLAFITYGLLASLAPVLALHILLLPINLWRYWQCAQNRLVRQVNIYGSQKLSNFSRESGGRSSSRTGQNRQRLSHVRLQVSNWLSHGGGP
jgi:hypothetical protein